MIKKKVAFILSLSTPYRTPLLERIARWDDVDLKVFYCSGSDPGRDWSPNLGESKDYSEILPGQKLHIPFIGENIKFNPIIWKELSEGNYECIIVGGYFHLTMLLSIGWALTHQVPYLINSESQLLNRRSIWKTFIKKIVLTPIIKKASAYLPTGKFAREYLIHYGSEPNRIFYFPNTAYVEFFIKESDKYRERKDEIKKELGIDSEFVVLFVGRLIKVKGLFTLLKAFNEVKKEFSNVSLLITGDGVLMDSLEEFVRNEKIEDVRFIGSIPNDQLPRYYAVSDIFVLPSLYEPWGVVVNEAMASGLPVILSDKVGSRGDLLKEGGNGSMFPSGDYEKLSSCILEMLYKSEELKKMGQISRGIIQKFDYSFCEDNLKKALLKIFKE